MVLKAMIHQAKIDYLQSKSSSKQAADLWSCVNGTTGCFKECKSVSMIPSHLIHSMNKCYWSYASECQVFYNAPTLVCSQSFYFRPVSVSLVKSHLKSLNITKSTGPDNLSVRFLKEIAD